MNLPKLALFDLDGTLVKFPREFLFQQAEEVVRKLELPSVERSEMEDAFAQFDFFRWVLPAVRETFMETYWELFDWNSYPAAEVLPGTLDVLGKLDAAGVKLAIVTSRHESADSIMEDLADTGILNYIKNILPRGGDDAHWYDKSVQIRQACNQFAIEPKDTVLVGDIPPDISSARSVGIGRSVAVLTGGIRKKVFSTVSPDNIIDGVEDLMSVFNS